MLLPVACSRPTTASHEGREEGGNTDSGPVTNGFGENLGIFLGARVCSRRVNQLQVKHHVINTHHQILCSEM